MLGTHDPSGYVRGLQQLLVSDKKRIGFLFGAGSSCATKKGETHSLSVPAIGKLTEEIVSEMSEYKDFFDELKDELPNFNIETILTSLEQKTQVIGKGQLNGLDKEQFGKLIAEYKNKILEKISVHKGFDLNNSGCLVQSDFARWIGSTNRKHSIEIFTTNYDYLFEMGLEHNKVPYYDGFSGSFNPFFNSDSVEDMRFLQNQTKLWKIHGSLGWKFDDVLGRVVRNRMVDGSEELLIYPSVLKYNESKKQPYESLMDRLTNFLRTNDSLLIICGYSFGDEHINARIESALAANSTSHVIAMLYDKAWKDTGFEYTLKDSNAYRMAISNSKISVCGFKQAVIGAKFGEWQLLSEPNKDDIHPDLYFDQDFEMPEIESGKEQKGGEKWTGKGSFKLPDFANLTHFLSKQLPENELFTVAKNAKK